MAFPFSPLPIRQQIKINGVWTDITTDTRGNSGVGGVTITRGSSSEQSQLSAGTCSFTLNNRNGKYSNDNPNSSLYRLLGRNTPYRNGIDSGIVSARFLGGQTVGTTAYDGSAIWTADKAALDITGDQDIAVDVEFAPSRRGVILVGKYVTTGNQRSWLFELDSSDHLFFLWSPDGTVASRIDAKCPVTIDRTAGRMQLRVQLDVNNGSGGWTCTFLQQFGTGLTGTYTTLGSTSGSGTTSVFSGSARLEIGDSNNGGGPNGVVGGSDPFVGKMYGANMRNGIAGTIIANGSVLSQAVGATTWVDNTATANTWTLAGSVALEQNDYRFYGEIPSLPNRWDSSGTDIYIPVVANDVIARANSGNLSKPVKSAIFYNLSQFAWDGYWPLEQEVGSTTINATYGFPGRKTGADFSTQPTDFPGTAGSMVFNDDTGFATATAKIINAGTATLATYMFYFKLDTIPATLQTMINFFVTGGTASRISLRVNTTTFGLEIAAPDGTTLVSTTSVFGGSNNPSNWTAMRLKVSSSSGTVTWEWAWYQVNQPDVWGTSGTYSGSTGRPWYWSSPGYTGKSNLQLAHIAMGRLDPDFTSTTFIGSTNAFNLERWDDRVRRLGAQVKFPTYVEGCPPSDSKVHLMGPQGLKTFMDLMQECADVAGGILHAPRDKSGLAVRSWELMINQTPVTFNYALKHLSGQLQPEPDLFLIENDVTLKTADGSSYRFTKAAGTLNTGDPGSDADAVGTYDVTDSINAIPLDLPGFTQRRVLLGTWDETRYPQVQVQMERAPFVASATLTAAAQSLDLGRALQISNPPPWLPPGSIGLLVSGYVETLGGFTQTLVFNTRPSGPYSSGKWGDSSTPTTSLWAAASTTLKTGVNSTATSLTFTTTDPKEVWSTTASGYHVKISGEVLTISSMGARTGTGPYEQVATVIRSFNNVVKGLGAGQSVVVVEAGRWI